MGQLNMRSGARKISVMWVIGSLCEAGNMADRSHRVWVWFVSEFELDVDPCCFLKTQQGRKGARFETRL